MEWHKCELEKEELYEDHVCTTLEDLSPMNCKRSKWELVNKGAVEDCRYDAGAGKLSVSVTTFLLSSRLPLFIHSTYPYHKVY